MRRDSWMNLNGLWEFDRVSNTPEAVPAYNRKILVPFPVESALSGIGETVMPADTLYYRRSFTVPESMLGQRILLHFGAVDWESRVFVNGQEVGSHRGGYAPFHFDVTDVLRESGEQEVRLVVKDQPGVLAATAKVFGDHGVSLDAVTQKGSGDDPLAEIVYVTYRASEGAVRESLAEIEALDVVDSIGTVIRVEDL